VRGAPQWITLRGADVANPPLLMIFGPGAGFTRMAPFFATWERDFTLVQWDQPGGGATFAKNGDEVLSLDRLAADAAAVAQIALARLGAGKLIVLGVSGGSIVGLKLTSARPDLVAAYVGTGQIVHWARQAAHGYRLALDAAGARGDATAVAALRGGRAAALRGSRRRDRRLGAGQRADRCRARRVRDAGCRHRRRAGDRRQPTRGMSLPIWRFLSHGRADWRPSSHCGARSRRSTPGRRRACRYEVPMVFLQGDADLYTPTAEVADYAAAAAGACRAAGADPRRRPLGRLHARRVPGCATGLTCAAGQQLTFNRRR